MTFDTAPFIAQAKRDIKTTHNVENAFAVVKETLCKAVDDVVNKQATGRSSERHSRRPDCVVFARRMPNMPSRTRLAGQRL